MQYTTGYFIKYYIISSYINGCDSLDLKRISPSFMASGTFYLYVHYYFLAHGIATEGPMDGIRFLWKFFSEALPDQIDLCLRRRNKVVKRFQASTPYNNNKISSKNL